MLTYTGTHIHTYIHITPVLRNSLLCLSVNQRIVYKIVLRVQVLAWHCSILKDYCIMFTTSASSSALSCSRRHHPSRNKNSPSWPLLLRFFLFIESHGVVLGEVLHVSPQLVAEHVCDIRTKGMCFGKEAVVVLPDVTQRNIYVHIASTKPLLYCPSNSLTNGLSLHVAIFKGLSNNPGHYKAVFLLNQTHRRPSLCNVPNSCVLMGN